MSTIRTPEEIDALIADFQASGLTQRAFCAREKISERTFRDWLHRRCRSRLDVHTVAKRLQRIQAELDALISMVGYAAEPHLPVGMPPGGSTPSAAAPPSPAGRRDTSSPTDIATAKASSALSAPGFLCRERDDGACYPGSENENVAHLDIFGGIRGETVGRVAQAASNHKAPNPPDDTLEPATNMPDQEAQRPPQVRPRRGSFFFDEP